MEIDSPRRIRNVLLLGTAFLFLARLAFSAIRTGPVVLADEAGYLINARELAGGLAGQLELAPFYRGGYSLLIVPLINLSSDQTVVYHLVLALNAALAASVFPLLYLLLTRFVGVPPAGAVWAALAGSVYPAVTVLSQASLSENALFPLVCVWLVAIGGLFANAERRPAAEIWAIGLGLSTTALLAVHGRMIVAVVLAGLVLLVGLRRNLRLGTCLLAVAVIVAGVIAVQVLNDHLLSQSYGAIAEAEAGDRVDEIDEGHGPLTAAANLVGQTWYLLVATFGLAAVVVVDAIRRLRRRADLSTPAGLIGPSAPEWAAIGLAAALLLVSAAAFPERSRPDMLIYGRYVEVISPVLIALGLVALARLGTIRLRPAYPLGFAALAIAVALIAASADDPGDPSRWNISALPFFSASLGPATLLAASLVAAVAAWLLNRVSGRGLARLGLLAAGLFAVVAVYGVWNPVVRAERGAYPGDWESPEAIVETEGATTVAYDLDHYDTIGLYGTQWFMPDSRLVLFHGDRQAPPSPFVLSGAAWARAHPGLDSEPLWRDAGRDEVLWRIGGP
ncbi:MAG TPA: hypothetical protein VIT85_02645 [Solirubrobacterales bacterium]